VIDFGSLIGERYRVIDFIGQGGMQDVYRAEDRVLGIDVALKTPQPGQRSKRFKASAQIAAKVNHHGVAKTFDYFIFNDNEYLVEEFVAGENLEQKLEHFRFLDPHVSARILHHLAKGIAASHAAGVIHRDLKPSNIMVSSGSNLHLLKITDFGIATLTKELFDDASKHGDITRSTSGTIKGALPYMAPEMMFRKPGDEIGAPADIWSLGALMFRLLTGEYPYGVFLDAAVNVKTNTRSEWPAFMTANLQFKPLAIELQKIVETCLMQDPTKRPSAAEIAEKCSRLCYLSVNRHEGTISRIIKNGYAGFADSDVGPVFFYMDSVYGTLRPDLVENRRIQFSCFPGNPRPRAHPVVVVND
jgi:serine/threonine-protein kinase